MGTLKALVVDDASFVRDLVKRTVRQHYPVIETTDAPNGRRAPSLMSREAYDLVLCDWEMPEMSGLELLQWMRTRPEYRDVPFIMITSRGDKDHVIEAVREGASEYLGKPFSPDGLSRKIAKVMGRTLKEAMSGRGRTSGAAVDALGESAELLTKKREPESSARGAGNSPASRGPAKPAARMASVRFADTVLKSVVRDISLTEVKVIAKRDQVFPAVLDQAVVDFETGNEQMARLNGYVYQLQAVEKRQDTDFVSVIIRFVDEDPKKLEELSRFIARFRSG